jgi:hypothetical protein
VAVSQESLEWIELGEETLTSGGVSIGDEGSGRTNSVGYSDLAES